MGKTFVTIIGRAVRPELKTVGETPLLVFSIPVEDRKTDQTHWYRINVWSKQGEALSGFLKQGHAVTVIGELQPRFYEDKDGNEKLSLEVRASDVQVQSSKSESADSDDEPEITDKPAAAKKGKKAADVTDDDIPF